MRHVRTPRRMGERPNADATWNGLSSATIVCGEFRYTEKQATDTMSQNTIDIEIASSRINPSQRAYITAISAEDKVRECIVFPNFVLGGTNVGLIPGCPISPGKCRYKSAACAISPGYCRANTFVRTLCLVAGSSAMLYGWGTAALEHISPASAPGRLRKSPPSSSSPETCHSLAEHT